MLFNSFHFAAFLPIVFVLYWFVFNKRLHVQNLLIVVVSYVFYGWWDWRFLFLIFFSSILDYVIGLNIDRTDNTSKRKWLLYTSLIVNLGMLGFFKYFNFFVDSFVDAFGSLGITLQATTLQIILPVGISFYTFQTLSYTIDIYRRTLKATDDPVAFLAFVSFFPQLVAGPIERASNLLPQFYVERKFDTAKAADGMRQILWGLFKKVVIADTCAGMVNRIFDNHEALPGSVLLLGAVYFAFQIYGDFSGYSDIAIGTAKLFGFDLMRNFAYPYFSRDMAEFWRRWHISLSTWFKDYLYIPLGGSRGTLLKTVRNTLIIFTVSGFWHGANWTFVAWGFLNGLYFLPLLLGNKNRSHLNIAAEGKLLPSAKEVFQMATTFLLTCIAWVFFRAANISQAFNYLQEMFSWSLFTLPSQEYLKYMPWILVLVLIEWIQREKAHPLTIETTPVLVRWSAYFLVFFIVFKNFFTNNANDFIYFQF
ncbi:MBOAT family protein [Rhodocytophaga rosea]|uniref:MBOAT family protein n=1 Tax=Rhodocytophaga rosea TaxID=2704465 RepID=A0A6C0GSI6_9BACT|nr:MBOAT family protein [Rhodocytophaga rosea]QHT71078.1 MBOAT family protein [Rhodocytophaga rosea]